MTLRILLAVDMTDPVAARLFWEGFRLSGAERAAIQARSANARRFADEVRTLGKVAAISAQVQRTIKGATHP